MKPYPSYKESGVKWTGEIPSDWGAIRLKYLTNQEKRKSNSGKEELLSVSEYAGIVPTKSLRGSNENLSRSKTLEGYLVVSEGNLVNNIMLMWRRGLGVSSYDGIVSPAYSVFSFSSDCYPRYFHYLLRTKLYTTEFKRNSRGIRDSRLRLYDDEFGFIYSILPSFEEQQQISNYLDHKTQNIDSLIEKTQQKIELLKEQRTSLINQVITKGLNPDVEMKDSGVEWIGDIPSAWKCGKLNYLTTRIGDGLHSTPSYVDESEYYFINGNNLKNGKVLIFKNTKQVDESEYRNHFIELDERTLLLSINGTIGNVSFYDNERVILGKSVCYIRCSEDTNHKFISYLIQSDSIQKYFTLELTGTTIYNLSLNSIRKTPVLHPNLTEQQQIVDFLDKETTKIDSLIGKEDQRIELLKEYRQSLISEVVTGKVDVRDEVFV